MQRSVLTRLAPVIAAALAGAVLYSGCTEGDPAGPDGGVDIDTDGKSVSELLQDGHASLKSESIDEALAYYEAAYNKAPNDPATIAYSALAKFAGISVDQKVVDLFKNRIGFTSYPNKLNALLSSDWLTSYPDRWIEYQIYDDASGEWAYWYDKGDIEWYGLDRPGYYYYDYNDGDREYVLVSTEPRYEYGEDMLLPGLATPSWVKGGNNSLYSGSLIDGAPSMETFALLLLANLLDKNTAGLNGLLDDVISAVFGSAFDDICERVGKLKGKDPVTLDPEFLEAANLTDLIDKFDVIGWAEINAVTSVMTAVKASLQWVASYDLNTNLNFLKFAWGDDFEEVFYDRLKGVSASDLPFGNSFLKARPGKMAVAKGSFIKAIDGLKASYEAILTNDKYPQAVKDAYETIAAGADQLKGAINGANGGRFYILESDPTTSSWPTSGNGIDIGKIFTDGYFSLSNLFETDGGKPVFYAMSDVEICETNSWGEYCYWEDTDPQKLTAGNYRELLEDAYAVALMLNTPHVTSIFVGPDSPGGGENVPVSVLPPRYGQLLFEKFYGLPQSAPPAPLAKAGVRAKAAVARAGK